MSIQCIGSHVGFFTIWVNIWNKSQVDLQLGHFNRQGAIDKNDPPKIIHPRTQIKFALWDNHKHDVEGSVQYYFGDTPSSFTMNYKCPVCSNNAVTVNSDDPDYCLYYIAKSKAHHFSRWGDWYPGNPPDSDSTSECKGYLIVDGQPKPNKTVDKRGHPFNCMLVVNDHPRKIA